MNFKAMIASVCAVFGTACTTPPAEPQKQTGKLVTDPSGCTYWEDSKEASKKPAPCIMKNDQTLN